MRFSGRERDVYVEFGLHFNSPPIIDGKRSFIVLYFYFFGNKKRELHYELGRRTTTGFFVKHRSH